jgi:ParB-like chromosome segregation protein Spo0J
LSSPSEIEQFDSQDRFTRSVHEVEPPPETTRHARVRDDEREDDADETIDSEDDGDNEPVPTIREGLPTRFRMRHTPHYVDELLGDAPLRTVREIPISEIEAPSDDRADVEELERSIRQLGVIEPLLVGRRGALYSIIAGMRRLRAAHRAGLTTVPCLVHELDETRFADMRAAAAHRLVIPVIAEPEAAGQVDNEVEQEEASPEPVAATLAGPEAMIGEAALGLEFVSALLPAMNAAGGDRLRWGVLTDLAAVEVARTKAVALAADILSHGPIHRASVDYHSLVKSIVSATATEARLRGVAVDVSLPESDREIFLDALRCRNALTGAVQCLLALAPRGGTTLSLTAHITTIRPALIVECRLHESEPELGPEAFARFFEAQWREHPAGAHGGVMLAALAHTARSHGGRVDVKSVGTGCLVTFVVPRLDS